MTKNQKQKSLANPFVLWLEGAPWRATALLVGLTWLLWARTIGFKAQYADDAVYLFQDPRLEGLTWSHFWAILTEPFFANYHPITTLTFLFDRLVWGQWVPGYHITHLLFYSAGVVLVYELFRRVLRDRFWAFIGAALYSAHTLHVEPVAWLACRKDVVCLLFYAGALLAYERYANRRDHAPATRHVWPWRDYLIVTVLTTFAYGAKGYAAVLPIVFFARDLCFSPRPSWRQVFDKIPLLGLGAGLVLATAHAQDSSSALIKDMGGLTIFGRFDVLLKIYALYVGRALVPLGLNAKYLVGSEGWYPQWVAVLGLMLLVCFLAGFFGLRRRFPVMAYALALFALPLATTMNTFFTLRIWMADRYLFLPTLGSALFLAWAGRACQDKMTGARHFNRLAALAFAGIMFYSGLTVLRTQVWSSLILLRSDTLRKNSDFLAGKGPVTAAEFWSRAQGRSAPAVLLDYIEDLAKAYETEGRPDETLAFREVLQRAGRGGADQAANASRTGHPEEAVALLTAVVEQGEWGDHTAAEDIADIYAKLNQPEKARQWYHRAFTLYKKRGLSGAVPLVGEMSLEFNLKNYARAVEILKELQKEAPGDPRGYVFEGRSLEEMGKCDRAYACYEIAEKLPDIAYKDAGLTPADLQRQMGVAAQKLGRKEDARRHLSQCLKLNPNDPQRAAIEQILSTL